MGTLGKQLLAKATRVGGGRARLKATRAGRSRYLVASEFQLKFTNSITRWVVDNMLFMHVIT